MSTDKFQGLMLMQQVGDGRLVSPLNDGGCPGPSDRAMAKARYVGVIERPAVSCFLPAFCFRHALFLNRLSP
jgi:hypothetical protein